MSELTVILPERSQDEVSWALRQLTRELVDRGHEPSMGLLGGEDGYGVSFSNDTFSMHPFCWCDDDTCAWCHPCTCPDSAYHYFVSGQEVDYAAWMDAIPVIYDGALDPRTSSHDPVCHWCSHPELIRHNFEHPASGTWVDWYKWIGRSMQGQLGAPWPTVFEECLKSLGALISVPPISPSGVLGSLPS